MPVGFITGQLRSERELGELRAREPVPLPSGFVTMLMTDIEGSTALVHRLGERYRELLDERAGDPRRDARVGAAAMVVETRADEFFAVFEASPSALDTAVAIQRELRGRHGPTISRCGSGSASTAATRRSPRRTTSAWPSTPRPAVCAAAHGGQILVSGDTREAAQGIETPTACASGVSVEHRLRGLPDAVPLFQIAAKGLPVRFPPLRTSSAH